MPAALHGLVVASRFVVFGFVAGDDLYHLGVMATAFACEHVRLGMCRYVSAGDVRIADVADRVLFVSIDGHLLCPAGTVLHPDLRIVDDPDLGRAVSPALPESVTLPLLDPSDAEEPVEASGDCPPDDASGADEDVVVGDERSPPLSVSLPEATVGSATSGF